MWLPCAIAICSAAERCSVAISCYVLSYDLREAHKERIRSRFLGAAPCGSTIKWIDADRVEVCDLPYTMRHLSAVAYLRVVAPRLLAGRAERFIYLDSDVLCRTDLYQLWMCDLSGATVGAVRDVGFPDWASPFGLPYVVRTMPEYADNPFFNSGVLLVDIRRWQEGSVERKVREFANEWKAKVTSDQDCLNFALRGHWVELPQKWNVLVPQLARARACAFDGRYHVYSGISTNDCILHYVTNYKPWNSRRPTQRDEFRLWESYIPRIDDRALFRWVWRVKREVGHLERMIRRMGKRVLEYMR